MTEQKTFGSAVYERYKKTTDPLTMNTELESFSSKERTTQELTFAFENLHEKLTFLYNEFRGFEYAISKGKFCECGEVWEKNDAVMKHYVNQLSEIFARLDRLESMCSDLERWRVHDGGDIHDFIQKTDLRLQRLEQLSK